MLAHWSSAFSSDTICVSLRAPPKQTARMRLRCVPQPWTEYFGDRFQKTKKEYFGDRFLKFGRRKQPKRQGSPMQQDPVGCERAEHPALRASQWRERAAATRELEEEKAATRRECIESASAWRNQRDAPGGLHERTGQHRFAAGGLHNYASGGEGYGTTVLRPPRKRRQIEEMTATCS